MGPLIALFWNSGDVSCGFHLIRSRYDNTSGTFTVPPGADGFYYLSTYLLVEDGEFAEFGIRFNGEILCLAFAQQIGTTTDEITTSCSAIIYGTEGKNFVRS